MAQRLESAPSAESKRRSPEMATQVTGSTHTCIDVHPAFYWLFAADRWTVIGGKLVPSLIKFPLAAGVNGVEVEKGGRVRFAGGWWTGPALGRKIIPWTDAPDGESYLRCVDTRPGNGPNIVETWISVFEDAHIGARETSPDEEAYAEWLESLVNSGKLPQCHPDTARRMMDRSSERLEKTRAEAAKTGGHGAAAMRVKQLEAEVAVLRAVVDRDKAARVAAKAKPKRAPALDADGAA